jgi:hypothetical protein
MEAPRARKETMQTAVNQDGETGCGGYMQISISSILNQSPRPLNIGEELLINYDLFPSPVCTTHLEF